MRNLSKIKKILSWGLKIAIVLVAYGFLYSQIVHGHDLKQVYTDILLLTNKQDFYLYFFIVFALMFVNWGIETRKWQLLISKLENVSYITAFQAVFAGMTISSFTPNRVGEFVGRVFILSKANKWEGVFVTIIGSISQLLITLIIGIVAALFFIPFYFNEIVNLSLLIYLALGLTGLISICLLLIAYFNLDLLLLVARKMGFAKSNPVIKYLRVFDLFNNKALGKILLLSFIRYLVFSTQYYLFLHVFHVDVSYLSALMLIALIFFIDTAIPTIVLTEWGVRASIAIYIFTIYFKHLGIAIDDTLTIAIVSASTLVWFVNLVVPALIGSLFVFKLKFDNQ